MNFFFLLKKRDISSELDVPIFQNSGKFSDNLNLYRARIVNNEWHIKDTLEKVNKNYFFKVNSSEYNEDDIFFLAEKKNFINNDLTKKLLDINNFTDTYPAYRANLKILYKDAGHSSYQSEYPFIMTTKKGSTLSPIKTLLSENIEKNFIFLRNITDLPIKEKFTTYVIDIISFKVIEKFECLTNSSNYFEIKDELMNRNYYIFSENYLVLPLFISVNNSHISFEHTQPPQLIIFKENQIMVKKIKKKINEEISKK